MNELTKNQVGASLQRIFTFTLVLYLILFLLENLFPGFVSNSFNLNILLLPLFVVGVGTSFFPPPEPDLSSHPTKPKISDYLTVIGFTVLTYIVIWYKLSDLPELRIWVALGSSTLVLLMSLLLLIFPDDDTDSTPAFDWKRMCKKRLFQPVQVPFIAIVIVILLLLVGFQIARSDRSFLEKDSESETIEESFIESSPLTAEEKERIQVYVYDVATRSEVASEVLALLKQEGFVIVPKGQSTGGFDTAVIQFDPDDVRVAREIEILLADAYPAIEKLPLPPTTDTTPHVILILN